MFYVIILLWSCSTKM